MEFKSFVGLMQKHVDEMCKGETSLFVVNLDKDELWNTYLDSFPPGTNEVYRERRVHDCSACRHFVRAFGNVVAIKRNKMVTIWDFNAGNDEYQPSVDACAAFVKKHAITDVFVPTEKKFGIEKNIELIDGNTTTWYHFHAVLPKNIKLYRGDKIGLNRKIAELRDTRNVFKRSLEEISDEAVDTVLDLTAQGSLYKGEEWVAVLKKFKVEKKKYQKVPEKNRELYCWKSAADVGGTLGRIRNHSIGVLLQDISEGVNLEEAVKKYEKIVAPTNYKRPKAIFTKRMVEDARKTVVKLGFENSLGRRHAKLDDITVNNILFANRDARKRMDGDVFDALASNATKKTSIGKLDKLEEIPISKFLSDVLPGVTSMELLLDNSHVGNMVSLIAPKDSSSPTMFKWDNGFSWAYSGNVTDSMKERVRAAGGRVDGALRFTHSWNHDGGNQSLMDLHVFMPGSSRHKASWDKEEIHDEYGNNSRVGWNHRQHMGYGGIQDVDYTAPPGKNVPIENISFSDISRMPEGKYLFKIHNWKSRQNPRSGFRAEIECGGVIHKFVYDKPVKHKQWITIAEITLKNGVFTVDRKMDSVESSIDVWGLKTREFYPVEVAMYSPNYWDEQDGIGHRHYFFMLSGCKNPDNPNGFFNEYLKQELMEHKRVFEALGSQMSVEDSDEQLSGVGFSATKRNSFVCRVDGSFKRMLKVVI